jgi:hypothetical protein
MRGENNDTEQWYATVAVAHRQGTEVSHGTGWKSHVSAGHTNTTYPDRLARPTGNTPPRKSHHCHQQRGPYQPNSQRKLTTIWPLCAIRLFAFRNVADQFLHSFSRVKITVQGTPATCELMGFVRSLQLWVLQQHPHLLTCRRDIYRRRPFHVPRGCHYDVERKMARVGA